MGLPLFNAPVESDLPAKTVKVVTTEPPRSSIRYTYPPRQRGRRNVRIQATLNRAMPSSRLGAESDRSFTTSSDHRSSTAQRLGLPPPHPAEHLTTSTETLRHASDDSWLEPEPSISDLEHRPLRDALREITTTTDPRQRRHLENHMRSFFGGSWDQVRSSGSRDSPLRESERRTARSSRGTSPVSSNYHDWMRTRSYLSPEQSTSQAAFTEPIDPPHPSGRAARIDGLGDRQRSLSPEGWDTLLTTLTPDPQPPSASASFASGGWSTSQNNSQSNSANSSGTSSRTTPPTVVVEGPLSLDIDVQCESGPENDSDDVYDTDRLPLSMDHRGSVEQAGSTTTHPAGASRHQDNNALRDPRLRRLIRLRRFQERRAERGSDSGDAASVSRTDDNDAAAVSTSDDHHHISTNTGDGHWLGMARIVRRLAERQDIPDEWWAAVGLSRTLPQHEQEES